MVEQFSIVKSHATIGIENNTRRAKEHCTTQKGSLSALIGIENNTQQ
ncbi:MAG: hypothetical protein IKB95_08585 [Bacteroidales bacterium]|nr:hypothetical protein [Bacteroidales bacterium]